jgi:hypothetical protein
MVKNESDIEEKSKGKIKMCNWGGVRGEFGFSHFKFGEKYGVKTTLVRRNK